MIRAPPLKCRMMLVSHHLHSLGSSEVMYTWHSANCQFDLTAAASPGEAPQRTGTSAAMHLESLALLPAPPSNTNLPQGGIHLA